ncbi:hypothetical protein N9V04_00590 [Bacteroidota bacterium]|nr:hypothetical protein [Bacteroidota bacterium]
MTNEKLIIRWSLCIFFILVVNLFQGQNKSVTRVFNDLIKAKGDYSKNKPKLVIDQEGNSVAYLYKNTIYIDQKAIDICLKFGEDSLNVLAYLLSHELTHYYSGHNWLTSDTKEAYKAFSFMENLKQIRKDANRRVDLEAQADLKGGFNAFIAGYDALDHAPKLLDKLYKSYHLDDELKGYPSLEERKKICEKQLEKLNKLKVIFDASTYAYISGSYKIAQDGFEQILEKDYNSREMYNNLGLAYLHDALSEIIDETLLIYPFEFDLDSRLNETSTRGVFGFDQDEIINSLELAIEKFNHALNLDRKYGTARINMACTYSILATLHKNDPEYFKEYIQEAEYQLKNNSINELDFTIVRGILEFQKGKDSIAISLFEKATKNGSEIAKTNLSLLNDVPIKTKDWDSFSAFKVPPIDNVDRSSILFGLDPMEDMDYEIDFEQYKLKVKLLKNSTLYIFERGSHVTLIQSVKDLSPIFKVLDQKDIQLLTSMIKEHPVYKNGTLGQYICYPNNNLVFNNNRGEIKNWFVYEVND